MENLSTGKELHFCPDLNHCLFLLLIYIADVDIMKEKKLLLLFLNISKSSTFLIITRSQWKWDSFTYVYSQETQSQYTSPQKHTFPHPVMLRPCTTGAGCELSAKRPHTTQHMRSCTNISPALLRTKTRTHTVTQKTFHILERRPAEDWGTVGEFSLKQYDLVTQQLNSRATQMLIMRNDHRL